MNTNPERIDFNRRHLLSGAAGTAVAAPFAMLTSANAQSERQDPFSGHLFLFRGRKANLIKIVFWDGTGFCLFTKRLEQGRFHWPVTCEMGGTVMLSSSQLSMLIEGIDWRAPERKWRPAVAG
jgi:transposase